jgi:regulatory protein
MFKLWRTCLFGRQERLQQLTSENDKYKKSKKLADYLLYRGWEAHLVYDKVKELVP